MSCLCDSCSALCCRYFVLEIDKPEDAADYDNVRWYLVHEGTFVFIEKKKWFLGVYARCKHLQPDNRCGIYATRPKICRKYTTDNCDYHGGEYDWEVLFSSAEQLDAYAQERLAEARAEKREKAKRKRAREAAAKRRGLTPAKSDTRRRVKARPKRAVTKRLRPNLLPALLGVAPRNVDRAPRATRTGNTVALPVLGAR
ncbi:MAG TPA: YkgJ family cysteine cluster protein [Tepidisphaeraceae bacterium]|nr:YkgJ family cysteine cluster protein [Tepidisphaeraceae bacterium]